MKIYSCILMLLITLVSRAQEVSKHYFLNAPAILQECSVTGDTAGYSQQLAPSGFKFTIVSIAGDYYIIRFWAIKKENEILKVYNTILPERKVNPQLMTATEQSVNKKYSLSERLVINHGKTIDNLRFFRIRKTDLDFYASKLIKVCQPVFGAAVLPFKYRPQTGDFTKDLSIANIGGAKISRRTGSFSFSILFGIAISSVSLDSLNTKGKIKKAEDRAAITFPFGVVWQWQKLQMGVFSGFDWLSKSSSDDWAYQGKQWFSIGIGFSIFSEESAAKKEEKNSAD